VRSSMPGIRPMSEQRHLLVELKTGKSRPAMSVAPVVSSNKSPWKGILLEEYPATAVENLDVATTRHVLVVQLDQPATIEFKQNGNPFSTLQIRPGQIVILPAMSPFSVRTRDTGSFVAVGLDPQFLQLAAHELIDPDRMELTMRVAIDEPLLTQIALSLKREAEAGIPGGRCYGETLANALAVHLVCHFATRPVQIREAGKGLARFQLNRAIEFVHAHLAEDISLDSLAGAAGLSPFHFARLFKRSTGVSPHQYVLRCRVERARGLLMRSKASIAEVAVEVGFCDQSHLAAHFKRVYGVSPKAFLQQVRHK
jgi:AraC family transcriptional regulator